MKKKVAVLTATRAEYGLLSRTIKKLKQKPELDVALIVTGMHLSPAFGLTYREIEADGIPIDKKIEILLGSDTNVAVSKTMGLAMISFAEYFDESRPDALIVLGDRYETLAVCSAAMIAQIPIFHLCGGEATEGLIDEAVRHSITKMAFLHFTTTEIYRQRVIQLGEDPQRVYNVGSMGVENVLQEKLMDRTSLENSLAFSLAEPYVLVTFHPVTLEMDEAKRQCEALLEVFTERTDLRFIITKANADAGGQMINMMMENYVREHPRQAAIYDSLGSRRYLSAVKYSYAVMGNSSSGIIEVPSFHVPTINIGNRQKGRVQAESIINCGTGKEEILAAFRYMETDAYRKKLKESVNPYEKEGTSSKIADEVCRVLEKPIDLRKRFYDLEIRA